MDSQTQITITKEAVAQMPVVGFDGRINLIDNPTTARKALAYLSDQPAVGFDTETRPNFRKGQNHTVALVQIATPDRCFLFRTCSIGIPAELRDFFENPGVTKIGLSLKDDFHNLHKIEQFEPHGFIELQEMVRGYSIIDASLQKIYAILFGQRISKGQRLSNWEATELTQAQQTYAAIDAWACLRIYNHLVSGAFDPLSSPFRTLPADAE